jgi:hypothetical protein
MKDEVVSCPPNCPTHDDYDLHKEGDLKLLLEGLKDMKRVKCLIHL